MLGVNALHTRGKSSDFGILLGEHVGEKGKKEKLIRFYMRSISGKANME